MVQPLERMLSSIVKNRQNYSRGSDANSNNEIILIEKIKKQKYDVLHQVISPAQVDLVSPEIVESWLRCYNCGLDLFKKNQAPSLEEHSFQALLHEKDLLMRSADIALRQLKNMLYNTNCIIILTDEQGVVLSVLAATDDKKNEENHMTPGEIWNEKTVGTCSHGLCLLLESPIQICGPEHYSEVFKYTIASSAPIFDVDYNLIGTLSIASMNFDDHNSHTLALAVSIAWSIQNELRALGSDDLFYSTLEAYQDAVMTVNKNHVITKANKLANLWLNKTSEELIGRKIGDVLEELAVFDEVMNKGIPILNAEIVIEQRDCKYFLDSVQPVKNSVNKVIGCVLNIKKINRSKKSSNQQRNNETRFTFEEIIGSSPQIVETIHTTKKFARIDANILIEGESGTGKELFAQAIHNERRPNGSFMAVNCAAIPSNLIESELFGYEGGSFTGAERHGRPGKIELANGGTLFLDEIGDMPMELQPVLLRVLEEKKIMRIGGNKYIPIDFNLVAATNKDLLQLVKTNQFREDLYYRLAVFKTIIPPLRERGPDVIRLAKFFIENISNTQQISHPRLSEAVNNILLRYDWPGNVRQLENAMFYAVNMCNGEVIRPGDLPKEIKGIATIESSSSDYSDTKNRNKSGKENSNSELSVREMERIAIIQVLNKTRNNIGEAARILGFSKSTLYRRVKNYNIEV